MEFIIRFLPDLVHLTIDFPLLSCNSQLFGSHNILVCLLPENEKQPNDNDNNAHSFLLVLVERCSLSVPTILFIVYRC